MQNEEKIGKKHSSFGKAVLLRKWQRVAHSNDDMHTCVLFSEYTQHKTHTPVHSYILRLSLSLSFSASQCVYTYVLCVMHTAILCMNVEIDTNQFRRKRCAHYLIFLFSFSRFLSHTETHTRITLSFSLSLARFQNRKRLNELRNFIEKIIPQNIYTYAVVRVCRTYFTYRPKTESCTTMCSCVCV